jgi:hypothetical protein
VQLDRTVHVGGARTWGPHAQATGSYGGWDRFGRLTRNSWVMAGYAAAGQGAGGRVPLWQELASFDLLSRKLRREHTVSVATRHLRGMQSTYRRTAD